MRLLVVTFILIACTLAFVAGLNARTPPNPLLIDAAVRGAPAWKLFTLCPVNRTNVPTLIERTA